MKVRLSHLRGIIRETLEEQGWVPGRWNPTSGEPVDPEDVDKMSTGGMDGPGDETEFDLELHEASLTAAKLRRATFQEVAKKFPRFVEALTNRAGVDPASVAFAFSSQGMMGLGGTVPLAATDRPSDPVYYWESNMLKYNSSMSLADAVRNAR